jgi:predicted dehydrogenase
MHEHAKIEGAAIDTLRLAVVGCGAVIEQRYVHAFKKLKWMPSVLIDPSPNRSKSVAGMLGGRFAEAGRALELAEAFDAAVVSVPHALHEPLCLELLRAGKHVLVEKPMAETADSCARMNHAAGEGGARIAVALMRHQAPSLRWLKAALNADAFGKVKRFTIREGYEYAWPLTTDAMWRKEQAGGGVLMDTGAHTMDQVIWWFGEPDDIEYFDDCDGGVEANCLIRMHWANGLEGEVELTRTRVLSNTIKLTAEKGRLSLGITGTGVTGDEAMLGFASPLGKPPFAPIAGPGLFVHLLSNFNQYAQGRDDANVVTGEQAARSVALIERCYAARKRLNLPWIAYQEAV